MDINTHTANFESENRSPLKEIKLESNRPEDECNASQKSFILFDMESHISKDAVALPTELNINDANENCENKPRLSILRSYDPLYENLNCLESILENEQCMLEQDFLNHLKVDFLACNDETQDSNVDIVKNILQDIIEVALNKIQMNGEINMSNSDLNSDGEAVFEENLIDVSIDSSPNNNTTILANTSINESITQDNTIVFDKLSSTSIDFNKKQETNTSDLTTLPSNSAYIDETYIEDEKPTFIINSLKQKELSTADELSDSFLNNFSKKLTVSSPFLNKTTILKESVKEENEQNRPCDETSIVPGDTVEQHTNNLNVTTDIYSTNEHTINCTYTNLNQTQDNASNLNETAVLENRIPVKSVILDTTINISNITAESCETNSSVVNLTTVFIPTLSPIKTAPMSESNVELNSELSDSSVSCRLQAESIADCPNEMGDMMNHSEYFDKECDITNGLGDIKHLSIDKKQSCIKEKDQMDMIKRLAGVEAECEKYKLEVTDLKQELNQCRQNSATFETKIAELKLKDSKNSTCANESNDQNEEIKVLRERESTFINQMEDMKLIVTQLESKLTEMQKKETKLLNDLNNKTQTEMQINRVMEEYEKSISSMVTVNEKMKNERDTAQMHLANIELAFSDVHQKYERCKTIIQGFKENEELLKQNIAMNEETILKQEQKYETLKSHAIFQLEKSNQELAMMKKQHEQELTRVTAQLKRYEIKNNSLMEALQQKSKECEQLSAVCDEFIGNV